MSFEQIIGNENVKKLLTETIKSKNILHSYIFTGVEGIGKKLFAKEFAKMILNTNNESHPDLLEINSEGTSIKIEQIREFQVKILEKPIISNKKVYIINDSEKMTKEAQNCLLKTLEEPPEFVVIILITFNENLMLNTIKSRCIKIKFANLDESEMLQVLKTKINIYNVNTNIIKVSEGSIGKFLQYESKKEIYEQIDEILKYLDKINIIELIKKAEIIYESKQEIFEILNYMNTIMYFSMKENYTKISQVVEIIEKTKIKLKANTNYDMCIDFLLFNLWEEINR